jgi:hypothetical protein
VPYRKEVERYLNLIQTTHVGRVLISHIGKSPQGRKVRIVPFRPQPKNRINAYAKPTNIQNAYPKNQPVTKTFSGGPVSITIPTTTIGTGRGSDVVVEYHPATFRQLNVNMQRIEPGAGPGEVLFHELIHALRASWGLFIRTSVPEHVHMDNFEEFCAIVAANIYRSERGFKQLRLDHRRFRPVPSSLSNSAAYYNQFRQPIEDWFRSQKEFCLQLAASPAAFNPIRSAANSLGLSIPVPMRLP